MIEWTHAQCSHPDCESTKDCPAFPTTEDRLAMAEAAYEAYAEADGTSMDDFIQDVLIMAFSLYTQAAVEVLIENARRQAAEYDTEPDRQEAN